MLKSRITSFTDKFGSVLPLWKQDQGQGLWNDHNLPSVKCCFGAAVAKAFDRCVSDDEKNVFDYLDGSDILQDHFALPYLKLESLFWVCGASKYPFGTDKWDLPFETVLANLSQIEHKPTLEEFQILYQERILSDRHSKPVRDVWNRITDREATIDESCCSYGELVANSLNRYVAISHRLYAAKSVDSIAELADLFDSDLSSLFWLCGANSQPVGFSNWNLPEVLSNLERIRHKPTTDEFQILFRERMLSDRHSDASREIWDRITTN